MISSQMARYTFVITYMIEHKFHLLTYDDMLISNINIRYLTKYVKFKKKNVG